MPFRLPAERERGDRLRGVLHVLYLIFNEGYASSIGPDLQRPDLAREAIRLTRALREVLPGDAEVTGLLALMVSTDARRAARTGPAGDLIPLTRQDRTLWDRDAIAEGIALITATLPKGAIGPYQLQAAIAAVHDEAARAEDTDWPQVVALNHAVAVAMVHGPSKGLDLLRALDSDDRLAHHHRLAAVRAHLLQMSGDEVTAESYYRIAASRTTNVPERNYLLLQAARLSRT